MSYSREVLHHIAQLRDIRNIMNSMKNLAFIETRKVERYLLAQQQVVANIYAAAEDFLAFHPCPPQTLARQTKVFILLGSERGFCGDFNEQLLAELERLHASADKNEADNLQLIGVGRKLCGRLENGRLEAALLDGADVAEEIPAVLNGLLREIGKQQARHGDLTVTVLHQDAERQQVRATTLLPPFQHCDRNDRPHAAPPLLNLLPEALLHELIEHYLFAVLHEIFYTSLMAENRRRLQHMQGAIQHLDERSETLRRKYNTVRQEEITEEIEVILMTAESLDSASWPH